METKTHWKKNNDSRYISGEDLMSGLRGFKPEMHVIIVAHKDADTFDQKSQQDLIKTGLYLVELSGQSVYKPVILNNTNAKFLIREFGSEYIEDWFNKPVTLYAQKDRRHGYVARFKRYNSSQAAQPKPIEVIVSDEEVNQVIEQIELIGQLQDLQTYYLGLEPKLKNHPKVIEAKNKAKENLS